MAAPAWAHEARRAMGSTADVLVWATDADDLVAWALDEIERCEASWSRFRPESELCRVNARAGEGPIEVSPRLWAVLAAAQEAHAVTGGLFDPTILPGLVALGYDRSFPFPEPAPSASAAGPIAASGFAHVALDPDDRTVTVPAGAALDLGGIGKGLAADLVVDGLLARGAISACVGMGGDVRVGGPGPDRDEAWDIPVEDPRDDRPAFVFPLVDEALAQSSVLFRRWRVGPDEHHHLIDPRTGRSATSGVLCAVATAREAWRAEAVAKAALVAGVADGLALFARTGVEGWLLAADGSTHATEHLADGFGSPGTPGAEAPR